MPNIIRPVQWLGGRIYPSARDECSRCSAPPLGPLLSSGWGRRTYRPRLWARRVWAFGGTGGTGRTEAVHGHGNLGRILQRAGTPQTLSVSILSLSYLSTLCQHVAHPSSSREDTQGEQCKVRRAPGAVLMSQCKSELRDGGHEPLCAGARSSRETALRWAAGLGCAVHYAMRGRDAIHIICCLSSTIRPLRWPSIQLPRS